MLHQAQIANHLSVVANELQVKARSRDRRRKRGIEKEIETGLLLLAASKSRREIQNAMNVSGAGCKVKT